LGYPENFRKAFAALRFLGFLERFRKPFAAVGGYSGFTRKGAEENQSSQAQVIVESTIGIHPLGCIQVGHSIATASRSVNNDSFGFWRLEAPLIKRPHRRRGSEERGNN